MKQANYNLIQRYRITFRVIVLLGIILGLSLTVQAQVTIGSGDPPDNSAVLELKASNKGFLGPRVALTSRSDQVTIPTPAVGLLVYNLGTAGLTYKGYVYWTGSEWRAFNNTSLSTGVIGGITCNGIALTPSTYTTGTPYTGTMMVPYTGGDGGTYNAQSIGPINGLTATLAPGNFNVGSGTLSYTITGTPTVTSPITTTFAINIGGKTCSAVIGGGTVIAPGDLVYYRTSLNASLTAVWLSAYASDLPVIAGKLRLDAYFNGTSNGGNGTISMIPRLVNISGSPLKIWYSAMTTIDRFNAGNYLIASGGYVDLDNMIYFNYGYNDILGTTTPRASGIGEAGHQEVVTVDVSVDEKWYRIYYFPIVDNMNTATTTDNLRKIYLSIQRLY